jgi:hypothetical protein
MGRAGLFRTEAKLLAEVLIRVVTLLEVRPPQPVRYAHVTLARDHV